MKPRIDKVRSELHAALANSGPGEILHDEFEINIGPIGLEVLEPPCHTTGMRRLRYVMYCANPDIFDEIKVGAKNDGGETTWMTIEESAEGTDYREAVVEVPDVGDYRWAVEITGRVIAKKEETVH